MAAPAPSATGSLLRRPRDDRVELIRSNKGGLKLIHRGYMYTVHKRRQSGGIRWRCTQRSLHCKGSISTGNGVTKINMPHNHVPDPHSVALARCKHEEVDETELYLNNSITQNDEDDDDFDLEDSDASPSTNPKNASRVPEKAAPVATKRSTSETQRDLQSDNEEVCLRWNSHHANMIYSFPALLQREQYVDVTLCTEGQTIRCHRLVLSSCSSYFEEILSGITPLQHPVIFLKGTPFWILKSLIDFMYIGEAHIEQAKLQQILEVAEALKIKGLTGTKNKEHSMKSKIVPVTTNVSGKVQKKETEKMNKPVIVQTSTTAKAHGPHPQLKMSSSLKEFVPHKKIPIAEPKDSISQNYIPPASPEKPGPVQKLVKKKLKRKSSELDPIINAPPQVVMRKGTKSRPIVKAPRYFHTEFENDYYMKSSSNKQTDTVQSVQANASNNEKKAIEANESDEDELTDAVLGSVVSVKSEPIDVEDTHMSFEHFLSTGTINFDETTDANCSTAELSPPLLENIQTRSDGQTIKEIKEIKREGGEEDPCERNANV